MLLRPVFLNCCHHNHRNALLGVCQHRIPGRYPVNEVLRQFPCVQLAALSMACPYNLPFSISGRNQPDALLPCQKITCIAVYQIVFTVKDNMGLQIPFLCKIPGLLCILSAPGGCSAKQGKILMSSVGMVNASPDPFMDCCHVLPEYSGIIVYLSLHGAAGVLYFLHTPIFADCRVTCPYQS